MLRWNQLKVYSLKNIFQVHISMHFQQNDYNMSHFNQTSVSLMGSKKKKVLAPFDGNFHPFELLREAQSNQGRWITLNNIVEILGTYVVLGIEIFRLLLTEM